MGHDNLLLQSTYCISDNDWLPTVFSSWLLTLTVCCLECTVSLFYWKKLPAAVKDNTMSAESEPNIG